MKHSRILPVAAIALMAYWPVWADGPDQSPHGMNITEMIVKAAGAKPAADESSFPKFEEVTKDMKSTSGLFTLWAYPADAKDKDTEKLLAQIPAGFLGEKFMLSLSFSGGGFFTGFPLEERVVKWAILDRQLLLVQPEAGFVVDAAQPVGDAVRRTYPERIRAAIPIVTKTAGGDPVIDLGALLKTDFADIGWMAAIPLGPGFQAGGGINASLSKWTKKKVFELNVEIGVELAIGSGSPPGSYEKKMVHYSFWKLPQTDYQPRIADDRVGYFLTTNQDWARPVGVRDLFNRYINRWHLVKRDASLSMCEPKQPIVYYIEKTVPIRFRRAVRDGILEWNKAYEKIGFVNAVEVRQQTDDNEYKDLDPEDMRYSFFRWIVTGAGFAMGPSRANPFTGQIYDADIIFDDSMVRFFEQDAQQYLPSAAMQMKTAEPALREFFERFPQFTRPTRDWERFAIGERNDARLRDAMAKRMRQRGQQCCEYADGMKHQMALGHAMLAGQPREVIDRFLYETIKEVVMHEVGHTLGLRHNFKASTVWTIDQIRERKTKGLATVGSVMDYNPILFFADKPTEGNFITPTIGPYDYWAIEYGYRLSGTQPDGATKPTGDKQDAKEKPAVAKAESKAINGPDGKEIPKEVLEKLPPEVRKMIESGAGAEMTAGAPGKPDAGPSFTGPPAADAEMLHKIASRAAEPELAYSTDEDTTGMGPDPRSNRFDMGADSLEWARTRVELVDKRMKDILQWAVKDKESWYFLRSAFQRLMVEKVFVLDYVGRYIGGQYVSRSHRGDPNAPAPFELVDTKLQRGALEFIEKHLFNDAYFDVPPELLNHLAAARWWHDGVTIDFVVDYPYLDIVGVMQWWNLIDRFFPQTLRRIHDAELKTASTDKLTLSEYIQRLQKSVWADTLSAERAGGNGWSDEKPYISTVRRSLQREYLNVIEPLVRTPPGALVSPDIHAMLQHSVKTLAAEIGKVMEGTKLDFASNAHLAACRSRIERMLEPKLDEYRSAR